MTDNLEDAETPVARRGAPALELSSETAPAAPAPAKAARKKAAAKRKSPERFGPVVTVDLEHLQGRIRNIPPEDYESTSAIADHMNNLDRELDKLILRSKIAEAQAKKAKRNGSRK